MLSIVTYPMQSFLWALYRTVRLNGNMKRNHEKNTSKLIITFILQFVFMPIGMILAIIEEISNYD